MEENVVLSNDIFLGRTTRKFFVSAIKRSVITKTGKYNKAAHEKRLDLIIEKWDDILQIIDEELPSSDEIEKLLDKLQAPKSSEEIGIAESLLPMTFMTTKDIRDKYVLSRLGWDLGILEELIL